MPEVYLQGAYPTACLTKPDAIKLCQASGKRLCTGDEWSVACEGPGNTAYPYGDQYKPQTCVDGVTWVRAARMHL